MSYTPVHIVPGANSKVGLKEHDETTQRGDCNYQNLFENINLVCTTSTESGVYLCRFEVEPVSCHFCSQDQGTRPVFLSLGPLEKKL